MQSWATPSPLKTEVAIRPPTGYMVAIRFGQTTVFHVTAEAADFLDYEIRDAESYATILRGADVELSQLEPGPLRGHHLRVGIPGGQVSWVVTNLPLRGRGRFAAGVWTLSVVAGSASRSLQHGIEVSTGSVFLHQPGAEHDGIYGRDFSIVCLGIRDEPFAETVRTQYPEMSILHDQPWRVSEPTAGRRGRLVGQFGQAAAILRTDENVRRSLAARTVLQDELLAAFLDAMMESVVPSALPVVSHAATLVRRAEELAAAMEMNTDGTPMTVSDLCVGCMVPRRTLSHAFHQVLGMGPATYLRRLRLNRVRRRLRQARADDAPASVTDTAIGHGFWHLGRFSSQYRKLFGESPLETARRSGRAVMADAQTHAAPR